MYWTIEDLNAGLCSLAEVGTPKPASPAATEQIAPVDLGDRSLRERLRDDALRAYVELGGAEYLKKRPDLLDKILAKQVQPDPPVTNLNIEVPQWMIELSERRLAYRQALPLAEDIAQKTLSAPTKSGAGDH